MAAPGKRDDLEGRVKVLQVRVDGAGGGRVDASATVTDLLGVYQDHIKGLREILLSKYALDTTSAGKKPTEERDKDTHMIKTASKRMGRGATPTRAANTSSKRQLLLTWCHNVGT